MNTHRKCLHLMPKLVTIFSVGGGKFSELSANFLKYLFAIDGINLRYYNRFSSDRNFKKILEVRVACVFYFFRFS